MADFYAHIKDNQIARLNIPRGTNFERFSFGKNSTDADYRAAGLWPIEGGKPTFDPETQVCEGPTYQLDGDAQTVNRVYVVRDLTPEELAERVRAKRANMVVSPFQAKAAMMVANIYSAAETIIQNSEDATLKLAWEYAIEWRRLSPAVTGLAAALNLSDEELDELFEAAALIEA